MKSKRKYQWAIKIALDFAKRDSGEDYQYWLDQVTHGGLGKREAEALYKEIEPERKAAMTQSFMKRGSEELEEYYEKQRKEEEEKELEEYRKKLESELYK